jgi:hypothetical protein
VFAGEAEGGVGDLDVEVLSDLPVVGDRADGEADVTDVLPALPLTPIGDHVNSATRTRSARHAQTIHASPDRTHRLLLTTPYANKKTETPATTRNPANHDNVIEGNFGLGSHDSGV